MENMENYVCVLCRYYAQSCHCPQSMVKVESILPRVRSHPIKPSHDSHNNKDTKDLNNFCEMLEVCARSIYFNTFSIFQPRSAANT